MILCIVICVKCCCRYRPSHARVPAGPRCGARPATLGTDLLTGPARPFCALSAQSCGESRSSFVLATDPFNVAGAQRLRPSSCSRVRPIRPSPSPAPLRCRCTAMHRRRRTPQQYRHTSQDRPRHWLGMSASLCKRSPRNCHPWARQVETILCR